MKPAMTHQHVSQAIAQLMPGIIRGVHLDFFVKRGVTQTQFLVLMSIHGYGRCTMSTLARNMHVRMPTATGIVNRLVRSGHVRRVPTTEDRRRVPIELTAKGRAFILAFQAVIRRRWEEVLKPMAPDELAVFHRVVTGLSRQVEMER